MPDTPRRIVPIHVYRCGFAQQLVGRLRIEVSVIFPVTGCLMTKVFLRIEKMKLFFVIRRPADFRMALEDLEQGRSSAALCTTDEEIYFALEPWRDQLS